MNRLQREHDQFVMDHYLHLTSLIERQEEENYLVAPFVRLIGGERKDLAEIDLMIASASSGRIQKVTLLEAKTRETLRASQKADVQLNQQEWILRDLFGFDVPYEKIKVFKW